MYSSTSTPAGCFASAAFTFATAAAAALGGVEDQVGRVGLEARDGARGGAAHLEFLEPVAEPLDRGGERVDRRFGVELGLFLRVGDAEVVGQRDAHVLVPPLKLWF